MRIMNNIPELLSLGSLRAHQRSYTQAVTRLSTGQRINRAADDPSGLIAAERLSARTQSLHKLINDTEFASHALGAREGALQSIGDLLIELEGLIVQSANRGGLGEGELEALQVEADSILDAIQHTVDSATFNGRKILADTQVITIGYSNHVLGAVDVALEFDAAERTHTIAPGVAVELEASGATSIFEISGSRLNLIDGDLGEAASVVATARERINGFMGQIGNLQNYLVTTDLNIFQAELENTEAARSVIEDADFAAETAELARAQVMAEAATSVILSSRGQAERALNLLG